MKTDPYGALTFAVGSEDDFWCFDYDRHDDMVRLHAVINSETGSFIMDAEMPVEVPAAEAIDYAQGLVDQALEWCAENGVIIDVDGWNQEPDFFVQSIRKQLEQYP
jgi:hypothetical protein